MQKGKETELHTDAWKTDDNDSRVLFLHQTL